MLEEFISFGSYPRVIISESQEEKLEILNNIYKDYIYKDYIYKDISFYLKENELISFDKFLKFVSYGVCSSIKIEKIVWEINISRRLASKFLFLVKNTFVLNFVPPFTKNKQK